MCTLFISASLRLYYCNLKLRAAGHEHLVVVKVGTITNVGSFP